jgi:hypothetical protein
MALIQGIQIIGILFALFMIYYTFINFKRKQLKKSESALWFVMWFIFLLVAIFPTYLKKLAETLSVYRTMDFLTILGFFFIILLTFHNYVQVKRNSRKLEEIVRKIAFRSIKKNKK